MYSIRCAKWRKISPKNLSVNGPKSNRCNPFKPGLKPKSISNPLGLGPKHYVERQATATTLLHSVEITCKCEESGTALSYIMTKGDDNTPQLTVKSIVARNIDASFDEIQVDTSEP